MDKDTTLLVMGTSRGGTTLIMAALGSHPRVAMLDEEYTGAVFHVTGGKIRGNKLCVPNQLEWEKRYRRWKRIFGFNGFLRKRMLYNKVPRSELSILDYLDRGKVQPVCILRNPDAVISSIKKRERRSTEVAIYRWTRCLQVVQQLIDETDRQTNLLPPAIISFEQLLKQPEPVLRELCQQIGLEFDPVMLEGPQRNNRYVKSGFDNSKAESKADETYIAQIPAEMMALYQSLLERDIGLKILAK